jgi:hypothetical protein
MYRTFLLTLVLVAIGCSSAERTSNGENDSVAVNDSSPGGNDDSMSAEIVKVRIVPFTTAQGRKAQKVVPTWKNTGTKTIRFVDADITTYDSNGMELQSGAKNYTIYATSDSKAGVAPGKTHVTLKDAGFVLLPGTPKATKAEIRIIRVGENAGF